MGMTQQGFKAAEGYDIHTHLKGSCWVILAVLPDASDLLKIEFSQKVFAFSGELF